MNIRVHVFISGKVQGVFFRSSTKRQAEGLGITGWVRNLADGRVEAIFEGEKEDVEQMVQWCRKGPGYARVEGVDAIPEGYTGEFKGFVLRH